MRPAALLLPLSLLFLACAPGPLPSAPAGPAQVSLDRQLGRQVAAGNYELAQKSADSLLASKDPANREIAAYWKSVCLLYRNEPDSALAILEAYHGKWTGGLRRVHSEAFLRLARSASESRVALRRAHDELQPRPAPDKVLQERVEVLQRESVDLRAEIARLETERLKYQKLIEDLRTVR